MEKESKVIVAAIDLGASSGRVFQVSVSNKINLEEMHRFKNNLLVINDHYYWDLNYLFTNIKHGIKSCNNILSIGIDTWGVDYVLNNKAYSYRDLRTTGVYKNFDTRDLYFKTGIQILPFNTIFQLSVEKAEGNFLMIPDYFNYLLTGVKLNEYTNMTTTQLLNYKSNCIEVNSKIEFNKISKLQKLTLKEEVANELNTNAVVVQVASHDSASAFLGSPYYDDAIIISFGTWSIVGCIVDFVIANDETFLQNFSNEGSIFNDYRFLKNTMGSWMYEKIFEELDFDGDYNSLVNEVSKLDLNLIVNVDDERFINPNSMLSELNSYLVENSMYIPQNIYEYAKCIFDSICYKYLLIINQIESLTNKQFSCINIIGGGSKNKYMCNKLSQMLNYKVIAGPVEATVIGNVIAQLLANDLIDKNEIKNLILKSNFIEEIVYDKKTL